MRFTVAARAWAVAGGGGSWFGPRLSATDLLWATRELASLLGARVGQLVESTTPDGVHGSARVAALQFQPEAAGEYLR